MIHERLAIRRGLDIGLSGKPRQALREAGKVGSVAISGHDFPGVRPLFRVEAGARLLKGQTVFVDQKRPRIAFVAPGAGTVAAINRGHRRSLDSVVIRLDGTADAVSFPVLPETAGREALRGLLLDSGSWPAFLARPFGRIPDPDAVADAIFVTATDTNPLAPDPKLALEEWGSHFHAGLEVLAALTDGPVFVCHGEGVAVRGGGRIRPVAVSGPHPAGLAGTHIHHLMPVGGGRSVWQIGYQDVAAIGHLRSTGRLLSHRIVAIAGSGLRDPALVRVEMGASLDDLLAAELDGGNVRVLSGPVLSGREAAYLGRYHNQVTVLAEPPAPKGTLARLRGILKGAPGGAIIPSERFESVLPLRLLPVPLLRALSVGDLDTARDLGCLELVEEDMALLSHVCSTGANYGEMLREVLDRLAEDG